MIAWSAKSCESVTRGISNFHEPAFDKKFQTVRGLDVTGDPVI